MNLENQSFYRQLIVYYFTGTGNTRRSAHWLEGKAKENRIITVNKPIESAKPEKEITKGENTLLVLGSPTHGFMPPYSMFRFALRLPRAKGTNAAVFSTRAGILLGKYQPPGLAGFNPFLLLLILLFKGYRLRGLKTVNMPSNWIQLHPGYIEKHSKKIIEKSRRSFDNFSSKIIKKKSAFISLNNVYEFIFGISLLPIAIMYFFIGRFFLAKLNFSTRRCDGCGLCVDICPVKAIKLVKIKSKKPYWTFACEACNRCLCYCPKVAIETSFQLLIFWFMISFSYSVLQILHISSYFTDLGPLTVRIREFLSVILIYPFLFLIYVVFYLLSRIPLLNSLFTWTSLTHYYHRYNEPKTKILDFIQRNNQNKSASSERSFNSAKKDIKSDSKGF